MWYINAAGLSALLPGNHSMQDYICGNISGAVMPNKKLSVILNREKNSEGVKRQWQGDGECLVLSIMDSLEGGIFTGKKLLVGGMWWAKVTHAVTLYHVHTDKAE